jgi:hypothetical protein
LISEVLSFLNTVGEEMQDVCSTINRNLLFEMSVEMSHSAHLIAELSAFVSKSTTSRRISFPSTAFNRATPTQFAIFRNRAISSVTEPVYYRYTPQQISEMQTYIDMTFLHAIELHEFVGAKWTKDKTASPNLLRVSARTTHLVRKFSDSFPFV